LPGPNPFYYQDTRWDLYEADFLLSWHDFQGLSCPSCFENAWNERPMLWDVKQCVVMSTKTRQRVDFSEHWCEREMDSSWIWHCRNAGEQ
jgi:hypothetical protein